MTTPDPRTPDAHQMRLVGHTTLGGAGDGMQINIKDGYAYFGHQARGGTSIIDVRDPRTPTVVGNIPTAPNTHSHKVQVLGDILLVNRERLPAKLGGRMDQRWAAGLSVFDISDPVNPREIAWWPCGARGVHRVSYWEEPYAYVTAGSTEFERQILIVLDLSDPTAPTEVARWWIPGMHHSEHGARTWGPDREVKLHHAIPWGDRLYAGWCDGGLTIHDIAAPTSPQLISHVDLVALDGPSNNTHSVQPIPGRSAIVATDEAVVPDYCHIHDPEGKQFHARILDTTDETAPTVITHFPRPGDEYCYCARGGRLGPHNIHEMRPGSFDDASLVFMTWFNGGVRVYDISRLDEPVEVAHFVPPAPPGRSAGQLNDVYVDSDGLVYVTERFGGGLYILELTR